MERLSDEIKAQLTEQIENARCWRVLGESVVLAPNGSSENNEGYVQACASMSIAASLGVLVTLLGARIQGL